MLLPTGVSKRGFEVQTNCSLDLRGRASWCVAHLVSDQLQNCRNSPKIGQIFAYTIYTYIIIYHLHTWIYYLVGGLNPSAKWWSSSVGIILPHIWKNKIHVPNHQQVIYRWFAMIFMFNLQLVRRCSSHVWWHRRYSFNYPFSGGTYHSMVTSMAGSLRTPCSRAALSIHAVGSCFLWGRLPAAAPRGEANGSFCG